MLKEDDDDGSESDIEIDLNIVSNPLLPEEDISIDEINTRRAAAEEKY